MKSFLIDQDGYYGGSSGVYIPEILRKCVKKLTNRYLEMVESEGFKKEFGQLLRDYVGRSSPLYLAKRLSEKHGCESYLKRENLNHTGAHKVNNTIGQILSVRRMGEKRIIAGTGVGQHGVAIIAIYALMDMECIAYIGKMDVERQYTNAEKMKMLGATAIPVASGSMILKDVINGAIRDWRCHPADTYYIIGSTVGPHPYSDMMVCLWSVISEETKKQLQEKEGRDCPGYLIACAGGESNIAGTIYHYINGEQVGIIPTETGGKGIETGMTTATIQLNKMRVIHGMRTHVIQNEDGQIEESYLISAGLGYPGIGPIHVDLVVQRRASVLAINGDEVIEAAYELIELEGTIPTLEFVYTLGALRKLKFEPGDIVVLTASRRGDKDIRTYLPLNEQQ